MRLRRGLVMLLAMLGTACSAAPTPLPPAMLVSAPTAVETAADASSQSIPNYGIDTRLRGIVDPAPWGVDSVVQFADGPIPDMDIWITLDTTPDFTPTAAVISIQLRLDPSVPPLTDTAILTSISRALGANTDGGATAERTALANLGFPDGLNLTVSTPNEWALSAVAAHMAPLAISITADHTAMPPHGVIEAVLADASPTALLISRHPITYLNLSGVAVQMRPDGLPRVGDRP